MTIQESELRRVSASAKSRALHTLAQWLYEQASNAAKENSEHEESGDELEAAYYYGLHEAFRLAAARAHADAERLEEYTSSGRERHERQAEDAEREP